jgi:hypothetical protein
MYTAADAQGEDYPTAHTDPPSATDKLPCGPWQFAILDNQQPGMASILDGLIAGPQPGLEPVEALQMPFATLARSDYLHYYVYFRPPTYHDPSGDRSAPQVGDLRRHPAFGN